MLVPGAERRRRWEDSPRTNAVLDHACEDEVVHRPGDGGSVALATIRIDRPAVGPATVHC